MWGCGASIEMLAVLILSNLSEDCWEIPRSIDACLGKVYPRDIAFLSCLYNHEVHKIPQIDTEFRCAIEFLYSKTGPLKYTLCSLQAYNTSVPDVNLNHFNFRGYKRLRSREMFNDRNMVPDSWGSKFWMQRGLKVVQWCSSAELWLMGWNLRAI